MPAQTLRRARAAKEGNVLYERGLLQHPAGEAPQPAGDRDDRWWAEDGSQEFTDCEVFVDGSCTTHAVPELRRAAWAAVEVDAISGKVTKCLSGVVPSTFLQTPQAAEFVVMEAVAARISAGVSLASDCLNVVQQMHAPMAQRLRTNKIFAGISRSLAKWSGDIQEVFKKVRKVAAHVEVDQCATEMAKKDARGNGAADLAAKAARDFHPQLPPAMEREIEQQWADAVVTARLIAQAGPLWPSAQPPDGRRHRIERAVRIGCENVPGVALRARLRRRRAATHQWADFRGISRCAVCLAARSKTGIAAQRECAGRSSLHEAVIQLAPSLGHDVWGAEVLRRGSASSVLLCCMRCGQFVESGSNRALCTHGCRGKPTRHGAAQIRRIRNGLHPRTGSVGNGATIQGVVKVAPRFCRSHNASASTF